MMNEGMVALWKNLKSMEGEGEEVIVDSCLLGNHDAPWDLCLLGHALMMKPFKKEAFKSTIETNLTKKEQLFTEKRQVKISVFKFANFIDWRKVINMGPWNFEKGTGGT